MPREDVPYPTSAICSIRERIAELRDELDQLLRTVNGVAGDANHDIKLISDNAALGITNDAVQHEIHLDLDASHLPAALVDSVNGQTGTVVLDGDDLDGVTPGNSVNDDIAALQSADTTLQGNINAEATARANADSSLATAINAALATIPGEVSSQITNNADIIQLQNDVLAIPNKVDKRTGAGKFAYTHDGSTQGDIALVDGTTAATIPIRDANGRLQAADPASGATDKTLVTANWISQTGGGVPNNLLHTNGTEEADGIKLYHSGVFANIFGTTINRTLGYYKAMNLGNKPTSNVTWYLNGIFAYRYSMSLWHAEAGYDAQTDKFTVSCSGMKTSGIFFDNTYSGNTTISLDVIDGEVWLIVHRVSQSNAFSSLGLMSLQKATNNYDHPGIVKRIADSYTPSDTLSEGYIS